MAQPKTAPPKTVETAPPQRGTYRHGDLRRALIDAGLDLARTGGPDAVVLREATRRAGVVPNAAYRHFANREDLLLAVRAGALEALAKAIEMENARLDTALPPAEVARASLHAVGRGYLAFAAAEPGLFRAAFVVPVQPSAIPEVGEATGAAPNPFKLLGAALDLMVEAGLMPAAKRPGAEIPAWSAVHGLAMLLLDGPLARMPAPQRQAAADRLIAMVERGL